MEAIKHRNPTAPSPNKKTLWAFLNLWAVFADGVGQTLAPRLVLFVLLGLEHLASGLRQRWLAGQVDEPLVAHGGQQRIAGFVAPRPAFFHGPMERPLLPALLLELRVPLGFRSVRCVVEAIVGIVVAPADRRVFGGTAQSL
jgi:hypothetical protein